MTALRINPNLDDPDGLFEALLEAHRGLDVEAGRRLDARIILLLANHIGDSHVLREAIEAARASGSHAGIPGEPLRHDG